MLKKIAKKIKNPIANAGGVVFETIIGKELDKTEDKIKILKIRKTITDYLNKKNDEFKSDSSPSDYDFTKLKEKIESSVTVEQLNSLLAVDTKRREKAKQLLIKKCIQVSNAKGSSKDEVTSIFNACIDCMYESVSSDIPKELLLLADKTVDSVTKNTKELLAEQTDDYKKMTDVQTDIITNCLKEEISKISIPVPKAQKNGSDNQSYLDRFSAPLFLEKGNSNVTLENMYISPKIKETGNSAAKYIMDWFSTKKNMSSCMLLCGNAGIGKSSLVSKIIADANKKSASIEFNLFKDDVLALSLRNHYENIDISESAEGIIMKLFGGFTFEELKGKLLVLDGLDEVCVLRAGFDGYKFLKKLSKLEDGFHVLITSREANSYFRTPDDIEELTINHLIWTDDETQKWCDNYGKLKPEHTEWSKNFFAQYKKLLSTDERKEVFCIPIILYLCGDNELNLDDHKSVGSVYNAAFRKLLLRKHLKGQRNTSDFEDADKKSNLTAWQFTKELAYQMFLLDIYDLVDSDKDDSINAKGFTNAKERTKKYLNFEVTDSDLELKKELALCPFAKDNGKGGITFAHKTVYEFFTAVKLYEDYFAKFSKDYFKDHKKDAPSEVIKTSIEAFRYKAIPEDIFRYLNKMDSAPFDGVSEKETCGFDPDSFIQGYIDGMKEHLLAKIGIEPAVEEYLYPPRIKNPNCKESDNQWMLNSLNVQISRSYANLTWFLTGHGFKNVQNVHESVEVGQLLTGSDNIANFRSWNFKSANLFEAELSGSNMRSTNLEDANLEGAKLVNTDFSYSTMKKVSFIHADLINAKLKNASIVESDFRGANFHNANLRAAAFNDSTFYDASLIGANLSAANLRTVEELENADLTDARYCPFNFCKTIFPDSFDPEEYTGMVKVDINGNSIKK